jgi:phage terminase large subunit
MKLKYMILLVVIMATVQFTLIDPHQSAFVNSDARYLLNSGGVGSGKTYSVVLRSLKLCLEYPGIKGLLGAQTMPLLRDTTMAEFEALVPSKLIKTHNKSTNTYIFQNGSSILFRPFDDANKFKSLNLGFIGIEEMTDIKHDIFKMLRTRLRQKGVNHSLFGATNPGAFTNWVYKDFFENPIPGSKVINSISRDNPFLPASYLADLETLRVTNPEYYSRMVEGIWGALEGVIYQLPMAQRVEPSTLPETYDEIIAGLDFGFDHPTAMAIIGIRDPYCYIIDELYKRHLSTSDIISTVSQLHKQYKFSTIYCDGARPEIIQDLQNAGLPAVSAMKDVFEGIMFVKGMVNSGRLIVSQNCHYTIREFDSYIWDQGSVVKEVPIKMNDDCMDAIRYAFFTHLRNSVNVPRISTSSVSYNRQYTPNTSADAINNLRMRYRHRV